ncbi:siderophore-interacting protein [Nocardioides donggukensis]|uniref:Siderophore-interacting protein n=1 Tax=Nocardioides donggukensis TaxID=2774019 RepID=A0A927K570_9ACTN|nr:siderophore-interacting protein [Nocardioides donggukensis]MBD8870003.1 siderophore-interacting protein [Nocardioides donggukensis]
MSTRAPLYAAVVLRREQLSSRFVRLVLGGPGLAGFASTGVPDEWVALTVPGQFQTRYYTVRSFQEGELVLDVVVHEHGLVTEWATGDAEQVVGQTVTVSAPRGSFAMPDTARWLLLVGDLTALPAIARIIESAPGVPVRAWCEVPDGEPLHRMDGAAYVSGDADLTWVAPPAGAESGTAEVVRGIDWPDGEGYFWMAGESAQMRAIRKHLMREVRLPSTAYDVMGYWRGGGQRRQPRAVDPGPIWRAGKAAGRTDEEIWAAYDDAREGTDG